MGSFSDNSLRLWDIHSGECVRVITGHAAPLSTISISPLGKIAVSGDYDGKMVLWDLDSGKKVHSFFTRGSEQKKKSAHEDVITSFDFSQDQVVLASGSLDATIKIWDMRKYELSISFLER